MNRTMLGLNRTVRRGACWPQSWQLVYIEGVKADYEYPTIICQHTHLHLHVHTCSLVPRPSHVFLCSKY